jgi:DNA-damage-inducible protein J
MTAYPKMIHIRAEHDLREEASAVLESFGMSMSDAVRLFLHRVVATRSFPLELKTPNDQTRAALDDAKAMRLARRSAMISGTKSK